MSGRLKRALKTLRYSALRSASVKYSFHITDADIERALEDKRTIDAGFEFLLQRQDMYVRWAYHASRSANSFIGRYFGPNNG